MKIIQILLAVASFTIIILWAFTDLTFIQINSSLSLDIDLILGIAIFMVFILNSLAIPMENQEISKRITLASLCLITVCFMPAVIVHL